MLAASNPSLRWDTRHLDLWLQCLTTAGTQQSNRWPCPFCGATTHFPNRCPFRANSPTHLPSEQRNDSGRKSSGTSRSFTLAQVPLGKHTAGTSTIGHVNISDVSSPTLANTVAPITLLRTAPGQDPCGPPARPHPWSPIRPFVLERELSSHPDKVFVKQLVHDLQHGCSIGYAGLQFAHLAKNLPTAYQQPDVIDATLQRECEAGRILGPFTSPPLPNFRTSGLGLISKHDGGWRIIYHLSAPHGSSINDYIDSSLYSLSYCSIDDAYKIINKLGPGALLSKIDLKDAFRLIPVRPADWNLLGIHWKQNFYIDTCLPFGLRSAPYLFNRFSDALHWILQHNYGVEHLLHYLDDFSTAGPANSDICDSNLHAMLTLCKTLNAPIKPSKVEGRTTSLTFLGI